MAHSRRARANRLPMVGAKPRGWSGDSADPFNARHHVPPYLQAVYDQSLRKGADVRVQLCISFQKSMFCVTTAAIQGLAPHPFDTTDPTAQAENRSYLMNWLHRLAPSRLGSVN